MTPHLRSHAQISERIIDHTVALAPELTDFVEGSVVRSIGDALAVLLQGVEYAAFDSARQAILTAAYTSFQFARLPAVSATGTITLTRVASAVAVTIPAGFEVSVPGSSVRLYESIEDATFAIGQTVATVAVRCLTVGTIGNTAGATITNVVTVGFSVTVTNILPFLSGREEETDEGRFRRFQVYVGNLSRGTVAAVENAVQGIVRYDANLNPIERVTSVRVVEPFRVTTGGRIGLVNVYVDNGSGTASAELKLLVENALAGYTDEDGRHPGYVAAGIELKVFPVAAVAVAVTCAVTVVPGWNVAQVVSAAEAALVSYLNGLAVFADVVMAELIAAVMGVEGAADVTFTVPTGNVSIDGRAVAGAVVVTA